MDDATSGFGGEIRISLRPIAAALAGLAAVVLFMAPSGAVPRIVGMAWAAALGLAAVGLLYLERSRPKVGRWAAVAMSVLVLVAWSRWLDAPELLCLLSLPVLLAAAMLDVRASVIVATVASVFLLASLPAASPLAVLPDLARQTVAVSLAGIWTTLLLMVAVYAPVERLVWWVSGHYQKGRSALQEARDTKARLTQAVESLTYANRQLALHSERMAAFRWMAEEAERAKATFVARVSHEFRTPLNIIVGMVNLMIETPGIYEAPFPAKAQDHLRIVHRNCQHLASMIDDVLDLSQAEAGRITLRRTPTDLGEVTRSALEIVTPMMDEKGLAYDVAVPTDMPLVLCDRTRVRQIILNLLSNAARLTEAGRISVGVTLRGPQVVISVADTGPGISEEERARIFEPFYRGAPTSWQTHKGAGLGLSISKQFVALHGGRMWVESEVGKGSTFFVELPVGPAAAPSEPPSRWINEDWVWQESRARPTFSSEHYRPRVVVVDETASLRGLLEHATDALEFTEARSLEGAAEVLAEQGASAVLVNVAAPDALWSTLDAARLAAPDAAVLGCAFSPRVGVPGSQALKPGEAAGRLIKPLSLDAFCAAVEEAIQRHDGRPGRDGLRRVLVVDDDDDTRELLRSYLAVAAPDAEVQDAVSGEQALALAESFQPDLWLLDLVLPGMDGTKVLQRKAAMASVADAPVVMITAQDPEQGPRLSPVLALTAGAGLSPSRVVAALDLLPRLLMQGA